MSDTLALLFKDSLHVAIGGAVGAVCRHLVGVGAAMTMGITFPYGTLLVNVLGSFGLAALLVYVAEVADYPRHLQLLIGTGFFGAFTTFSTFSNDTLTLLEYQGPGAAAGNVAANIALCLLAAWLGIVVGKAAVG